MSERDFTEEGEEKEEEETLLRNCVNVIYKKFHKKLLNFLYI
jgi:hypothetical protein